MKKIQVLPVLLLLILTILLSQCRKEPGLNVTLYDKTVPEIKSYIAGKWKVNFATGGIANQGQKFYNTYIEFRFKTTDSMFYFKDNIVLVNSPIVWRKVRDIFRRTDSTYIAEYTYGTGGTLGYGIERIKNDTLLIYDPGPDGFTYYLTHQ
jgi:hypothetical protein